MDEKDRNDQMIESYKRGIKEKIEKVDNIRYLQFIHRMLVNLTH